MLAARQRLLMRRARDSAIDTAIAALGAVILLPDPDVRRRVCRSVSHVGLAFVARQVRRMDRAAIVACPIMVEGVVGLCGSCLQRADEMRALHCGKNRTGAGLIRLPKIWTRIHRPATRSSSGAA